MKEDGQYLHFGFRSVIKGPSISDRNTEKERRMKKRSIPEAGKIDWTATGSFLHKPKQGWFHSNEEISRGVTYRALVSVKSETCIVSVKAILFAGFCY